MRVGIYTGSFDPITNGHLNVIERAVSFCDKIIIAIGTNEAKRPLFSGAERVSQIQKAILKDTKIAPEKVEVKEFFNLAVAFAKEEKASFLIRGVRSTSDFEYELQLAQINKQLSPELETIFIPALPEFSNVSSSVVKELAKYKQDISHLVPKSVATPLMEAFGFIKHGNE